MKIFKVTTYFNDAEADYALYEGVVLAEDEEDAIDLLVEYDGNADWRDDTTRVVLLGLAESDFVEGVVLTNNELTEQDLSDDEIEQILSETAGDE